MKKFALPALAAALALAACADSTPDDADATTAADDTAAMEPAPTATETTVVTTPGATATSTGDKVTIGPNGVKADVGDADTRVKVDTKNDTLTVED